MVTGCSSTDEPDYLPPYEQTLCEMLSDSRGVATRVRFGDGRELPLVNDISKLTPDSVYRIAAAVLEDERGATLYNAEKVYAPMPAAMKDDKVRTDPLDVLTVWRDNRYINLRLSIKRSAEASHYLGTVDDGPRDNPDGTVTYCLRLYHDNNGDDDHFRHEILFSCPIYPLEGHLRHGVDSVCLTINTPSGLQSFSTPY